MTQNMRQLTMVTSHGTEMGAGVPEERVSEVREAVGQDVILNVNSSSGDAEMSVHMEKIVAVSAEPITRSGEE